MIIIISHDLYSGLYIIATSAIGWILGDWAWLRYQPQLTKVLDATLGRFITWLSHRKAVAK
jgi:hypothetical protein